MRGSGHGGVELPTWVPAQKPARKTALGPRPSFSATAGGAWHLRPYAHMVPHGIEPRTLRLLAVRSNQLSHEAICDIAVKCALQLYLRTPRAHVLAARLAGQDKAGKIEAAVRSIRACTA